MIYFARSPSNVRVIPVWHIVPASENGTDRAACGMFSTKTFDPANELMTKGMWSTSIRRAPAGNAIVGLCSNCRKSHAWRESGLESQLLRGARR